MDAKKGFHITFGYQAYKQGQQEPGYVVPKQHPFN